MGSKKQALMERKEQLTAEKQAYLQTVEWVLAADKNVSEEDKEIFLLTTVDRLLEQESDAEAILGMDATTYARQITKQTADKVADKPIRIFVFAGFIIMSLYLIVMGIIDFFSKESTFYLGTFFVSLILVVICIACMLLGGYILWKHYSVTESKSMAAYFLIGSGIVIMYVFVLVFLLTILPNFGQKIASGALIEVILGIAGFTTAGLIWRKK
ncbi:hypothetical protein UE46_05920 [Listeria weihenstephanensis]|uniref:DUF1129 domain-containing protein n=1 Tax=Listeria weihenstephanensis TaxID=1006155 RepID=A0A1S7FT50_9LIST|nr:DUF1129 family protein [Listeria weihenstephanensis]AQY50616.1 hypothetical protein UE46_05920 [Listeria weihenstephanensis]